MINSEANNEVINYDVHGISRIQSNLAGIVPSVFQVNQIKGNIDLIFKILYDGKSEVGGAHRSSHKLFLKDLSANTKVYYFVNRMLRGIYCMLHDFPAPWLQYVITNILIPLKLLQKGYSFVHAACLDSCDEGSLIIAPPNTGKTHTALFLNRTGFNYLSDDMTIIKGNKAYCYPTDLTVTPFHIKEFDISYVWKEHLKMISSSQLVILSPVPFGKGNMKNLEATLWAQRKGKNVLIIERRKEDGDFTGGTAGRYLHQLRSGGARTVRDKDEAISEAESLLTGKDRRRRQTQRPAPPTDPEGKKR